ncbi:MAG TPA: hypothetical protein VKT32_06205 [Chthonomonadaceae bacterium]|nr:hypothetical protein [Chthonomonadaceae bacterium]
MYRFTSMLLCALSLVVPALARADSNAVVAEPNPVSVGQSVTFHWYFTGTKVVVAGGRFGNGAVVTGRTKLTDQPRKTTRYTFDVWYRAPVKSPATGKTAVQPLHSRYSVLVEVVPPMASYHDSHGWQISYVHGWQMDKVSTPDEGDDGLVFFQPEDDSVERLAVAIMPVRNMNSADLIQKIQADVPAHYDSPQFITENTFLYRDTPAVWAIFTGLDQTHPGTRTQSMILAFVRDGHAYVISARTQADRFAARRALLERMVKSFSVTKRPTEPDTTARGHRAPFKEGVRA